MLLIFFTNTFHLPTNNRYGSPDTSLGAQFILYTWTYIVYEDSLKYSINRGN